MNNLPAGSNTWRLVRFPSVVHRKEFLDQVRLWNLVEGLPPIEVKPLADDGSGLRLFAADSSEKNVLRLIDAFGGFRYDVT